jgi:type III secretory pathway component EscV
LSTLYRLALNVSSTRLILLQADAGRVIEAFGSFVVRGDYIVGRWSSPCSPWCSSS